VLLEVRMDSRGAAGGRGPAVPSRATPRRRSVRDEALARVERWKRAIAVAAVVAFGALIGLVGTAGARGAATIPTRPPLSDPSGEGGPRAAPRQSPGDEFFGRGGDDDQGGGFAFGNPGSDSQSSPLGRSGAS
jgi:hypothetical protein